MGVYRLTNFYREFHMSKGLKFLLKAGFGIAGCVAAIGAAQATTLTAIDGNQHSLNWQNIASASYTLNDTNNNGNINAGEMLTFTIEMDKLYWGMHAFDALKVWIDGLDGQVGTGIWNFSTVASLHNEDYSDAPYTGANEFFTFNYEAVHDGALDLYASVMCSADLSKLVADNSGATPSESDWAAWSYGINRLQGEDAHYNVSPVPEPETYAMFLVGLGLLGFTARRRKDFTA